MVHRQFTGFTTHRDVCSSIDRNGLLHYPSLSVWFSASLSRTFLGRSVAKASTPTGARSPWLSHGLVALPSTYHIHHIPALRFPSPPYRAVRRGAVCYLTVALKLQTIGFQEDQTVIRLGQTSRGWPRAVTGLHDHCARAGKRDQSCISVLLYVLSCCPVS